MKTRNHVSSHGRRATTPGRIAPAMVAILFLLGGLVVPRTSSAAPGESIAGSTASHGAAAGERERSRSSKKKKRKKSGSGRSGAPTSSKGGTTSPKAGAKRSGANASSAPARTPETRDGATRPTTPATEPTTRAAEARPQRQITDPSVNRPTTADLHRSSAPATATTPARGQDTSAGTRPTSGGAVTPRSGSATGAVERSSTSGAAPSSHDSHGRAGASTTAEVSSSHARAGSSRGSHPRPSRPRLGGHARGGTRDYHGHHHRYTPPHRSHDHRYARPSWRHCRAYPRTAHRVPHRWFYRPWYTRWWVHPYYRWQYSTIVVVHFGFAVYPWDVAWVPPARSGWVWVPGYWSGPVWVPGHWAPVHRGPVVVRHRTYVYVPGYWQHDIYVEGYYRVDSRDDGDWEWVEGYYLEDGTAVPGHWVPAGPAPAGYTWEPGFFDGETWVGGFWRPEFRAGYYWVGAVFDEDGVYQAGYWMPVEEEDGEVWIPGWFDGEAWNEGYWVDEEEYYASDPENYEPEEGWDEGWDDEDSVVSESDDDDVPLAIPVDLVETDE